MTAIRLAFALGVALLAAACLPVTTKTPIGSTAAPGADPALMGVWRGTTEADETVSYFHFLAAADGTMTVLLVTLPHDKNTGDWSQYTLTAVTLGGHRYLNARSIGDNGKPVEGVEATRNTALLYTIADGTTLTLYLIGEAAAKDAIKAGKIEGTVEPGQYGDAMLTAAPGKLDAFFASQDGAKLFTDKLATLKKVE